MTLRHLKIFAAVCRYGGITKASEQLHLSQPSVSTAVRELEKYYGIKLFDRISRRLYITGAGKQFLSYALHIVSLFDEMEKASRNWDALSALRIGSSITIGTCLLPSLARTFSRLHPLIKIHARISNSAELEKWICSDDIDLALTEGIIHHPSIISEKFMDDELILICAPGHPLTEKETVYPEELRQYDFILREKGSGTRELFDSAMLVHNIEINPVWESVSTQAIIQAVTAGLGLSVIPLRLAESAVQTGEIRRIKPEGLCFRRAFHIIHHRHKYISPAVRDFISICHSLPVSRQELPQEQEQK